MNPAEIQDFYFVRLAAAAVRGALRSGRVDLPLEPHLRNASLDELNEGDCARVVASGLAGGLRLHRFKRTMQLPRVAKILGWLRGFAPASLLDVGSGRGAFLWPLLDAFPGLPVTALEQSSDRAAQLAEVQLGGVTQLRVLQGDIASGVPLPPVHDLVTALEVWEHIPQVDAAARHCVEAAQRAVLVSVPSREDDNPEHIHLLNPERLRSLLSLPRLKHLRFDAVPGHLLAIATLHDHG